MERQKIFWVVLSVSVFVVIVLVVGVFLLRQRPPSAAALGPGTVNPISGPGTQIYEYQREAPVTQPGSQPGGDTETMRFYIGEGQDTQGQPQTGAGAAESTVGGTGTQQSQPQGAQAAGSKAVPAKPAAQAKAPAQSKPPARVIDYWIQTGAYKSQGRAEELATQLSGKGLAGRVFTSSSKGQTLYRVRIGPYGNKSEAEKFLTLVKQIQGLEASYISQVAVSKSVN
jgi:cell division septation protein DedD